MKRAMFPWEVGSMTSVFDVRIRYVQVDDAYFYTLSYPIAESTENISPTYYIMNEPFLISSPATNPHPLCSVLTGYTLAF